MASSVRKFSFISFVRLLNNGTSKNTGRRPISTVGFIGLGNMGKHMATNLVKKGFDVIVFDVNSEAAASIRNTGAKVASSLVEVSSNVDCVVTSLPDNQRVMDVYSGNAGIIQNVKKGAVLLDASTVDPKVPQALGPLAEERGVLFLDSPVSGGVIAAQNAQLTFMVGGSKEGLDLTEKVFLAMGKKIFHCGHYGSGQTAKICNNMVMAISMVGLAEGMNLGIRLGLDPKILSDVINTSSGRCWSSDVYNPVPGVCDNVPSSKDYQGGFYSKLLMKDLMIALDIANRSSSSVHLGSQTLQFYKDICKFGFADRDFSIIYQIIKENKLTPKSS